MYIGNVKLDNNVFLAPMAGVTDMPFRVLCREMGCGLVYSEMVSAKGIMYNNENTNKLLFVSDKERPAAVQLFGSNLLKLRVQILLKDGQMKPAGKYRGNMDNCIKNYVNDMSAPERVDVYGEAMSRKNADEEEEEIPAVSASERVSSDVNRVRYDENVQNPHSARVAPEIVPEDDDFGGFTVKRDGATQPIHRQVEEQPVHRTVEEHKGEENDEPESDANDDDDNLPSFMKRLFGKSKK